jgi:hypothetical protein
MTLLSGAIHLAGDVASPVLDGTGAVVGAVSGNQKLTDIGHAIASPTQTLSNAGGILSSAPAFTTGPAPSAGSNAAASTSNNSTGGSATTTGGGGGGGGGGGTAAVNYAPIISAAQGALGQALAALNSSNAEVDAQGVQQGNVLASNQATQNNTYQGNLTKDAEDEAAADETAKTQGNSDLTSLMRLLGGMGAGGSSVETMLIPKLVQNAVQSNISGASTTKATNDQSADTAWNTFLDGLNSQKQQLADQIGQQKATNNAAYAKEAQQLNGVINTGPASGMDATSLDEMVNNIVSTIPNVVNWTPSFSGVTPTYSAPQLSTYEQTPTQIANASGTVAPVSGAAVIPYLASLTQQKTDANGNPIVAADPSTTLVPLTAATTTPITAS